MFGSSAQAARWSDSECNDAGVEHRGTLRMVMNMCGGAESEYGTGAVGACLHGIFALSVVIWNEPRKTRTMRYMNDVVSARNARWQADDAKSVQRRRREGMGIGGMEGSKYTHGHCPFIAARRSRSNGSIPVRPFV